MTNAESGCSMVRCKNCTLIEFGEELKLREFRGFGPGLNAVNKHVKDLQFF
jgi:hypothetical protein